MTQIGYLQMLYAAETIPNEELTIRCWPDSNEEK